MSVSVLEDPVSSPAVFDRSDELREASHEQVVFGQDRATGLRAIIALHDTTLGPGLGGTRFYPYASEAHALTDVLRLSQGMTCKAAAADMPLGGAKAVIIGDPRTQGTRNLFEAYGRLVQSLAGRYYTAADVGTTAADLEVVGRTSDYVVGRPVSAGGSGDSGRSTASGVFAALEAAAAVTWGSNGLADKRVGVEGVGKVGRHLVTFLLRAGARVVVSDPDPDALDDLRRSGADVTVAPAVIAEPLDVYAPCALGASLTGASVADLRARVVCGAANNQLLDRTVADRLRERSIAWVPDYVANAGGLIQVGSELSDRTAEEVETKVRQIGATTREILRLAAEGDTTTLAAAQLIVDRRLAAGAVAR